MVGYNISPTTIKITSITSIDDFIQREAEWDACVHENGGDIYFTSSWLKVWWRHYGKNRSPIFLMAYSGGRCVACIPFFEERFSPVLGGAIVIKLSGVHHDFPIMRLPVDLELKDEIIRSVLQFLWTETKCDVLSLSPLSSLDPAGEHAAMVCDAIKGWRVARNDTPRVHAVSFLPDCPEKYLASLSSRLRKNYRQSSKRMKDKMAIRDHVANVTDGPETFVQIAQMQAERMQHYGGDGTFEAWPGLKNFYLDLIPELVPRSMMLLIVKYGEGELICGQIGFRIGPRFYWHITGRSMRDDLKTLGVGSVAIIDCTKMLIESGVQVIEDGSGDHSYKDRLGSEMQGIRRLIFVRDAGASAIRSKILLLWMRVLQLVYYKIWYLEMAPRISRLTGRRQRPLLSAWIATRL